MVKLGLPRKVRIGPPQRLETGQVRFAQQGQEKGLRQDPAGKEGQKRVLDRDPQGQSPRRFQKQKKQPLIIYKKKGRYSWSNSKYKKKGSQKLCSLKSLKTQVPTRVVIKNGFHIKFQLAKERPNQSTNNGDMDQIAKRPVSD